LCFFSFFFSFLLFFFVSTGSIGFALLLTTGTAFAGACFFFCTFGSSSLDELDELLEGDELQLLLDEELELVVDVDVDDVEEVLDVDDEEDDFPFFFCGGAIGFVSIFIGIGASSDDELLLEILLDESDEEEVLGLELLLLELDEDFAFFVAGCGGCCFKFRTGALVLVFFSSSDDDELDDELDEELLVELDDESEDEVVEVELVDEVEEGCLVGCCFSVAIGFA
jgi:hypothetical protein